jgi:predicted nucleic acid-binding protein
MYILDTNVIYELRKISFGRGNGKVAHWAKSISTSCMYLSAITVQEIEIGVLLAEHRDLPKGTVLRTWLEQYVLPAFSERILPVDTTIARCSAAMHVPNPMPFRDSFIAATALVHKMTLVTRNVADFQTSGVSFVNPWE